MHAVYTQTGALRDPFHRLLLFSPSRILSRRFCIEAIAAFCCEGGCAIGDGGCGGWCAAGCASARMSSGTWCPWWTRLPSSSCWYVCAVLHNHTIRERVGKIIYFSSCASGLGIGVREHGHVAPRLWMSATGDEFVSRAQTELSRASSGHMRTGRLARNERAGSASKHGYRRTHCRVETKLQLPSLRMSHLLSNHNAGWARW